MKVLENIVSDLAHGAANSAKYISNQIYHSTNYIVKKLVYCKNSIADHKNSTMLEKYDADIRVIKINIGMCEDRIARLRRKIRKYHCNTETKREKMRKIYGKIHSDEAREKLLENYPYLKPDKNTSSNNLSTPQYANKVRGLDKLAASDINS